MININPITQIIRRVTKDILLNENIEIKAISKGHQDIVTEKDLLMERTIFKELKNLYPSDVFIGEEENQNQLTQERTWILDPIDGTLNFSRNHPLYGVQLTLYENKEALASIIYLPETEEMYTAIKGHGAYLNETRLTNDDKINLSQSIITFGDFSKSNSSSRPFQIHMIEKLMDHAMKIRIQGASSVDFAYTVAGKNNCHIIFTKRIWELAAGLLLAKEAGLHIHEFTDQGFEGSGYLISANENLTDEILSIIK